MDEKIGDNTEETKDETENETENNAGRYISKYIKPNTPEYVHLEVYQMAYDFSIYLHRKVMKFPKPEKFTLQKDIRDAIDGILDELELYEKLKKVSYLYNADRYKSRLERKIRMAYDLGYSAMNRRTYEYCAKELRCIGGKLGNLIKTVQKENKK